MTTATTLVTADQLFAMGESFRGELVAGVLRPMPPGFALHGAVIIQLAGVLFAYVSSRRLGRLFCGQTGFILQRNPDTVRAPDISFVAVERLPDGWADGGYLELAPDLAVEVLSPSDRTAEVLAKVAQYLDVGTRLVWVVDPEARTVTVYEPDRGIRLLAESDTLDGGAVLPGFRCAVASLFEGIPRA